MSIEFLDDAEREILQLREALKHQHRLIYRLVTQVNEIANDVSFILEKEAKRERWREIDEDYDRPKYWDVSAQFYSIMEENQCFGEKQSRLNSFRRLNEIDLRDLSFLGSRIIDIDCEIKDLNLKELQEGNEIRRRLMQTVRPRPYWKLKSKQASFRRKLKRIRLRSKVPTIRRGAPIREQYHY
jgi:hypothetical protein